MAAPETTSRVFIVNKAGHDFSSAEKYGTLIPITSGDMNVFRPDRALYHIQETLKDFDEDSDYLLLSGNVFTNSLAVATLFGNHRAAAVNFLVYDAKHHKYLLHTLGKSSKGELIFFRK